jgi:copper chaperone CopZ
LIGVVLAHAIEPSSGTRLHREEIAGVNVVSSYIHALNGRLRIKVAEIKGLRMKALEVEGQLRKIDGITQVRANPTTGNVLVLYDPARVGQDEILGALHRLGYLRESSSSQTATEDYLRVFEGVGETLARTLMHTTGETLARTLMHTTMELAVRRLVSALM